MQPEPAKRPLRQLFIDPAHSEILERTITLLDIKSVKACLEVTKQVNNAITSSSTLQLALRKAFHAIPPTLLSSPLLPPVQELKSLLAREERLTTLNPSTTQCIHTTDGDIIQVDAGLMLVLESFGKRNVNDQRPELGKMKDGWTVWELSDGIQKQDEGGKAGLKSWKFDFGEEVRNAFMLAEDNVIAIATAPVSGAPPAPPAQPSNPTDSSNPTDNGNPTSAPPPTLPFGFPMPIFQPIPGGTAMSIPVTIPMGPQTDPDSVMMYHRIYFYTLKPPSDHTGDDAIPHPEATLPFIEIAMMGIPGHPERLRMALGPDGRLAVHILNNFGSGGFVSIWDWKKGLGLCLVSPICHLNMVEDMAFISPFALALAAFRDRDIPIPGVKSGKDGDVKEDGDEGTKKKRHLNPHYMTRGNRRVQRFPAPFRPPNHMGHRPPNKVLTRPGSSCDIDTYLIQDPDGKVLKPTQTDPTAYENPEMASDTPCTFSVQDLPRTTPMVSFLLPEMKRLISPFMFPMFAGIATETFTPRWADIYTSKGMEGDDGLIGFGICGTVTSGMGGGRKANIGGVLPFETVKQRWEKLGRDLMTGEAISNRGAISGMGVNGKDEDGDEDAWVTDQEDQKKSKSKKGKQVGELGQDGGEASEEHHHHPHGPHCHCTRIEPTKSKEPCSEHRHLDYIPWEEWRSHAHISSQYSSALTPIHGLKTMTFVPHDPNGEISSQGTGMNEKSLDGKLVVRDYNPAVVQGGNRLDIPLGSFDINATLSPRHLATTDNTACPLESPTPINELVGPVKNTLSNTTRFDDTINAFRPPSPTAATTKTKDRKGKGKAKAKAEEAPTAIIENGLPFREYERELEVNDEIGLRTLFWDGKYVVLEKKGGADIMSF